MDIQITDSHDEEIDLKNNNLPSNMNLLSIGGDYENFQIKLQNPTESLKRLTSKILKLDIFNKAKIKLVDCRKKSKLKHFYKTSIEVLLIVKKILLINLRYFHLMQRLYEEHYDLQKLKDETYQLTMLQKQADKLLRNKFLLYKGVQLFLKKLEIPREIDLMTLLESDNQDHLQSKSCNINSKQNNFQSLSKTLVPIQISSNELNQIYMTNKFINYYTETINRNPGFDSKQLTIIIDSVNLNYSLNNINLLVSLQIDWFSNTSKTFLLVKFKKKPSLITESDVISSENLSMQNQMKIANLSGIVNKEATIYKKILKNLNLSMWTQFLSQDNFRNSVISLGIPEYKDVLVKFYFDITGNQSIPSNESIKPQLIQETSYFLSLEYKNNKDFSKNISEKESEDGISQQNSNNQIQESYQFSKMDEKYKFYTKRKNPLTLKVLQKKLLKKIKSMKNLQLNNQLQTDYFHIKSQSSIAIGDSSILLKNEESQTDFNPTKPVLENNILLNSKFSTNIQKKTILNMKSKKKSEFEENADNITKTKNNSSKSFRKSLKSLQDIIELNNSSYIQNSVFLSNSQKRKQLNLLTPVTIQKKKKIALKAKTFEEQDTFFRDRKIGNYGDSYKVPEMNKMHKVILETKSPHDFHLKFVSLDKSNVSKLILENPLKFNP